MMVIGGLPVSTTILLLAVIAIPVVAFLLFIHDRITNDRYINKLGWS